MTVFAMQKKKVYALKNGYPYLQNLSVEEGVTLSDGTIILHKACSCITADRVHEMSGGRSTSQQKSLCEDQHKKSQKLVFPSTQKVHILNVYYYISYHQQNYIQS